MLELGFYNHAELVYNGAVTYRLTNDYIGLSRRKLFSKESTHLYSATIHKNIADSLRLLRLDTLHRYYQNPCVLPTSGDEYFLTVEHGSQETRIYLHQYYHPVVAQLIALLNTVVPEEHRLRYLSADTRQDCR